MSAMSSPVSSSQLTAEEIASAAGYLASTRDNLIALLNGLTEPQWDFQPHSDAWSIRETLEHIALVEATAQAIVGRLPDAPVAAPDRPNAEIDAALLAFIPDRANKLQSPPQLCPTRCWTGPDALQQFLDGRSRSLDLLQSAPALRGHLIPHPVMGPWDGYQWILAGAAHGARHTGQIAAIKSSPDFPASA